MISDRWAPDNKSPSGTRVVAERLISNSRVIYKRLTDHSGERRQREIEMSGAELWQNVYEVGGGGKRSPGDCDNGSPGN